MNDYPVNVFEPTVVLEPGILSIVPVVWVEGEESLYDFLRPSILEVPGEKDVALDDLLVYFVGILSVGPKRQLSEHEFVEHDPD